MDEMETCSHHKRLNMQVWVETELSQSGWEIVVWVSNSCCFLFWLCAIVCHIPNVMQLCAAFPTWTSFHIGLCSILGLTPPIFSVFAAFRSMLEVTSLILHGVCSIPGTTSLKLHGVGRILTVRLLILHGVCNITELTSDILELPKRFFVPHGFGIFQELAGAGRARSSTVLGC